MTVLVWVELIAGGLATVGGILVYAFGDFWGILITIGGLLMVGMGAGLDYIHTIRDRQEEIIKYNGWDEPQKQEKMEETTSEPKL